MKKSMGILILSFMFIMLIRFIGLTYGYYSLRINGNTGDKSISVDSKYLAVVYTDGTATMNFDGDYFFPGNGAEKTFTVENTGEDTTTYNILIDNVVNEFERIQDLRYDLYINDELIVDDGAINNNEIQYLYFDRSIEVGKTDNVRFVFTYAETEEVQNVDMNKGISFRFNIDSNLHTSATSETNSVTFVSKEADLNYYRIYGNSIQETTPTIDTPVETQSVGDKTVNLLKYGIKRPGGTTTDMKKYLISTLIELTPGNYKLSFDTITNATTYRLSWVIFTDAEATNEITDVTNDYFAISGASSVYYNTGHTAFLYGSNNAISVNDLTITITNTCYVSFIIVSGDTTTSSEVVNPQLQSGTSITEYEPYGRYKIPVTVRGKNILDISKESLSIGYYLDSSGDATSNTSNGRMIKISAIDVEPSTTYTISSNLNFYTIWLYGSTSDTSGISKINAYNLSKKTFTTPENCTSIRVSFDLASTNQAGEGTDAFEWLMLEIGEGDGVYEPYVEPQTYNIYLDEPLKKTGDNADYIDFKRQMLVRYDANNLISETPIKLPSYKTIDGTNIFEVGTSVTPSSLAIEALK